MSKRRARFRDSVNDPFYLEILQLSGGDFELVEQVFGGQVHSEPPDIPNQESVLVVAALTSARQSEPSPSTQQLETE